MTPPTPPALPRRIPLMLVAFGALLIPSCGMPASQHQATPATPPRASSPLTASASTTGSPMRNAPVVGAHPGSPATQPTSTRPAGVRPARPAACASGYYRNTYGVCVHRPVPAPVAPAGATAKCNDGTYSFSQHRSGTCSHHHGVAVWLQSLPG